MKRKPSKWPWSKRQMESRRFLKFRFQASKYLKPLLQRSKSKSKDMRRIRSLKTLMLVRMTLKKM